MAPSSMLHSMQRLSSPQHNPTSSALHEILQVPPSIGSHMFLDLTAIPPCLFGSCDVRICTFTVPRRSVAMPLIVSSGQRAKRRFSCPLSVTVVVHNFFISRLSYVYSVISHQEFQYEWFLFLATYAYIYSFRSRNTSNNAFGRQSCRTTG